MSGHRRLLMGIAALMLALPASYAASPEDFRARLHDNSDALRDASSDVRAEVEFGRDVAARILNRYSMLRDEKLERYLNLVGSAVAAHGPRGEIPYRFAVLDADEVNAYAAPGGYIFVTRGALATMQDEAELAAVLAHEIAHVTQRHIVKRLNIHGSDASPETGFAHFFGGAGDPTRIAFDQAVDKAIDLLFSEGLDHADEYEADEVGLLLLTQTGYDPHALSRYLDRVSAATATRHEVLAKTHPRFEERLARLDAQAAREGMTELHYPRVEQRFAEYVKFD